MAMRKLICFFAFVLTAVPLTASAQSLLPDSFGAWTASDASSKVAAAQAEQFSPDHAGVLREFGLTSAERRDYSHDAAATTVTLYTMVDPSAAYGAFTFLRDMDMKAIELGDIAKFATGSRERSVIVVGNLVLDVSSPKTRPADGDVKILATSLAKRADQRPFPLLPEFLPESGLELGSERYVLGPQALAQAFPPIAASAVDWLGFNKSAEAIVARYHVPGEPKNNEALLLIAEYPTQQIAADQYGSLGGQMALNVDPGRANGRPLVWGTRSAVLIALLANVDSRDNASAMLKNIHYASEVTWNEPTHELTDPSISTIVVGAIIDTGSILMLALAAGIGFGGFRLLVKLALPGRVFDRNDQVEILQLGISSKPIKSTDFH